MKNYVIESYDYNTKAQECDFYHIQEEFEAETDEKAEQIFQDTIVNGYHQRTSESSKYINSKVKYALLLSSVDDSGEYFGMSDYVFDN